MKFAFLILFLFTSGMTVAQKVDTDLLRIKQRMDSVAQRLSDSVEKMQRVFFASEATEKVELLADKIMIEPVFFEEDGA